MENMVITVKPFITALRVFIGNFMSVCGAYDKSKAGAFNP
jgi:hypothetical protein